MGYCKLILIALFLCILAIQGMNPLTQDEAADWNAACPAAEC